MLYFIIGFITSILFSIFFIYEAKKNKKDFNLLNLFYSILLLIFWPVVPFVLGVFLIDYMENEGIFKKINRFCTLKFSKDKSNDI